jgi:hypothetical protein
MLKRLPGQTSTNNVKLRVCQGEVVEGAKRSLMPFMLKGIPFSGKLALECCTVDKIPLLL